MLGTALALVFAIARVLNQGDSENTSAQANTVAAAPTEVPVVLPVGPQVPVATGKASSSAAAKAAPVPLATPDGPCAADEVTVTPVEGRAAAGSAVPVVLQLSGIRPACTFRVSAKSLVAKVSLRGKSVWSTQQCPRSISVASVVVRSAEPTSIQVAWSGRKSDAGCSRSTDWALPGNYQVMSAAIGSEPSTAALKLTVPERPVVVKTIKPKPPTKTQSSAPTTPDTGH